MARKKKGELGFEWYGFIFALLVAVPLMIYNPVQAKVPDIASLPLMLSNSLTNADLLKPTMDTFFEPIVDDTIDHLSKQDILSRATVCGTYFDAPIIVRDGVEHCINPNYDNKDEFLTRFNEQYLIFSKKDGLPFDFSQVSYDFSIFSEKGKNFLHARSPDKIDVELFKDKKTTAVLHHNPSFIMEVNYDFKGLGDTVANARKLYETCKEAAVLESCLRKATVDDKMLDTEDWEYSESCGDENAKTLQSFAEYVEDCFNSPDHTCACRNNLPEGSFDIVKNTEKEGVIVSLDDKSHDIKNVEIVGQFKGLNKAEKKILLKNPTLFGSVDPEEVSVADDGEEENWPTCSYLPRKSFKFCLQSKHDEKTKQTFAIVFSPRVKLSLDTSVLLKGYRIHIDADCSSSETAAFLKRALEEEGAEVVYYQDEDRVEDAVACESRITVEQLTSDVKNDRQSIFLTLQGMEEDSDAPISVSYRALGSGDEISSENKLLSDAILKAVFVDSEVQASSVGDEVLYRTAVSSQIQLSSDFQSNEAVVLGIIKGLKEYGKQSYELLIEQAENLGYHLTTVDMKFDSDIADEKNFPVNRIGTAVELSSGQVVLMPEDSLIQNPKEMCDVSKEEGVDCSLVAAVIAKSSSFAELKRGDGQPHGLGHIFEDEVLAILNGIGEDIEEDATETVQERIEAQIRSKNAKVDAQFNNMFRITDKARYLYATTFRSTDAEDVLMQIRFTAKKLKLVKHYLEVASKPVTTSAILQAYHDGAASIFMNGQSKKYLQGEEDSINYVKDVEALYNGFNSVYTSTLSDDVLALPVDSPYVVTSCYGPRDVTVGSKNHPGVDFRAAIGANIYATHDGFVELAKMDPWGHIGISSKDGKIKTRYMHNSRFADGIVVGKEVKKGELIAFAGDASPDNVKLPPHLHYEMYIDGKQVDPLTEHRRGELQYKTDSNCNYWGAQDNKNNYPYVAEIKGRLLS